MQIKQGLNNKMGLKFRVAIFIVLLFLLTSPRVPEAQERGQLVQNALNQFEETQESVPTEQPGPSFALPSELMIDFLDFKETDLVHALKVLEQKSGYHMKVKSETNLTGVVSVGLQNISLEDVLKIVLEPFGLAYVTEKDKGEIVVMSQDVFAKETGVKFDSKGQARIVLLKYIDKEDWVPKLNALKSREGKILTDMNANQLILIDAASNLAAMEKMIKEADVPLKTEIFHLTYLSIGDIKDKVSGMLSENLGYLEINERSNNIVITDTESKIQEIAKFLESSDQKIDIGIQAEVLRIRLNEAHRNGIDWQAIVSNYESTGLSTTMGMTPVTNLRLSAGTITNEDYQVLLDALGAAGEVKSLLKVEIETTVNAQTELELTTQRVPQGILKTGIKKLIFISREYDTNEIDVVLSLVPKVMDKKVNIQINSSSQWILRHSRPPQGESQQIFFPQSDVKIGVEESELIVLGGVDKEQEVSKIMQIPVLGNLPFVGFVFRRENKFFEKTEYVVFLTPRIIGKK